MPFANIRQLIRYIDYDCVASRMPSNNFLDIGVYSDKLNRRIFTYLKDDLSKFFAIEQLRTTLFMVDMNPSNGTLNTVREISFPSLNFTSVVFRGGGSISDNVMVCSVRTSDSQYHILHIINTDTWTLTSYQGLINEQEILGFSQIFDTDQVVLTYLGANSDYFTLKTAYDKLDLTELYIV